MTTTPDDALKPLEPLVAVWRMEPRFPQLPPVEGHADVAFEWMPGGKFLVERWTVPIPEAPDGLAVLGPDPDRPGGFLQPAPTAAPSKACGRSATPGRAGRRTST